MYLKTMTQQLRPGRLREGQQWEEKVEGPGESRFKWLLFRGWGTRGDAVYETALQEGELPSLAPTAAERKPSGKDGSGLEWGSRSGRGGLEAAISDPFEVLLAQLHLAYF